MKKVYVHAYCQQNLGDDMFVLRLVRRYPNVEFHTRVKSEYRQALSGEQNLIIEDPGKNNRLLDQFSHRFCYDAFVKIGGSIFMEPLNWEKKGTFPAWQCKLLNSNKFIIGANFGPYYTEEFLARAYSSLRYYHGVCFRDQTSYELFQDIPQVNCAPDVLFRYDYPVPVAGEGVGISVIAPERKLPSGLSAEEYYTAMAKIADMFIENGQTVRLLGFCKAERDDEAVEQILARMKNAEKAQAYLYTGDIAGMLDKINQCQTIIASRFHAMVIGFALKKKVLPVIYSQKQTHVLQDLGFSGQIWDLRAGERMTPEQAATACDEAPVVEGLEKLASRSDEQFAYLDAFLR